VQRTASPTIGTKLRSARIDRSLSLEETAWRTRIRPELLRALELEDWASIGHHSFVRTHLSSYARFLGIDPQEVVAEFEAGSEPGPSSLEELDRQVKRSRKPPRAKWLIAAVASGAVLIGIAVAGYLGGQAERPAAEQPLGVSAPVESLVPSDGPSQVPSDGPSQVPAALARVQLHVEAVADTQVAILVDGEEIFEGVLAAGTARTFRARRMIEILAADAGSILLTHNGTEIGEAGDDGTAFRARFGPQGRRD
jgi:cytoskeletal protein RodZ